MQYNKKRLCIQRGKSKIFTKKYSTPNKGNVLGVVLERVKFEVSDK